MTILPTLAIVGRPNVGKSTLFNRLIGKRQAIVHDQPGVTRDRITGRFELEDGQPAALIDTGGLVPGDDPLGLGEQVALAIEESDVLLFMVDGKEGLTTADQRVWDELRMIAKPTVLVVNKSDTKAAMEGWGEFYQLGVDPVVLVSAEHGLGIGDLDDAVRALLPKVEAPIEDDDMPSIAIVGRPNVGKSSLINRLLGEDRTLVSPVAGTTRDPIDSVLEQDGRQYRLIDTAGIRRRSQVTGDAEALAVLFARRQIERADVAVLVLDASQGIRTGDLSIGGDAWERGRPVIVALNKWDLLDEEAREELEKDWPRLQEVLTEPARVNVSALSGRRIDRLLPAVDDVLERQNLELGTGELNRFFERQIARHSPPHNQGKPWKLFYTTQVSKAPPTFMLFANRTLKRSDPYRRYLENRLRETYDLAGVPIRLVIRKR
ncbi:MAG: ribosome biogenesis GTPase Der [Acidobacteriota bacterium]